MVVSRRLVPLVRVVSALPLVRSTPQVQTESLCSPVIRAYAFGKFKSSIDSPRAFHKLRELVKKGLDMVKDELQGSSSKKKRLKYMPTSSRTDLIAEDNETISYQTDTVSTYNEIRRRDPSFSLPDFVAEVQGLIRPVMDAYSKGDAKILNKYCCKEMIERCTAKHAALQSHGLFSDNKLLDVSEIYVREAGMMGTSPMIIVAFKTQETYCVRYESGKIKQGSENTIHSVDYLWAMQQVEAEEELGEERAIYLIWRLRDIQKLGGVQALI